MACLCQINTKRLMPASHSLRLVGMQVRPAPKLLSRGYRLPVEVNGHA